MAENNQIQVPLDVNTKQVNNNNDTKIFPIQNSLEDEKKLFGEPNGKDNDIILTETIQKSEPVSLSSLLKELPDYPEIIIERSNNTKLKKHSIKKVSIIETLVYKNLISPQLQQLILHIGWTVHPPTVQILPTRISSNNELKKIQLNRLEQFKKELPIQPGAKDDRDEYVLLSQSDALTKYGGAPNSTEYRTCQLVFKLVDIVDRIDLICEQVLGKGSVASMEFTKLTALIKEKEEQLKEITDNNKILEMIKEERQTNQSNRKRKTQPQNHFIESLDDLSLCMIGIHFGMLPTVLFLLRNKKRLFTDKDVLNSSSLNINENDIVGAVTRSLIQETQSIRDNFNRGGTTLFEWFQLHSILVEIIYPLLNGDHKAMNKAFKSNKNIVELVMECKGDLYSQLIDKIKLGHESIKPIFVQSLVCSKLAAQYFEEDKKRVSKDNITVSSSTSNVVLDKVDVDAINNKLKADQTKIADVILGIYQNGDNANQNEEVSTTLKMSTADQLKVPVLEDKSDNDDTNANANKHIDVILAKEN